MFSFFILFCLEIPVSKQCIPWSDATLYTSEIGPQCLHITPMTSFQSQGVKGMNFLSSQIELFPLKVAALEEGSKPSGKQILFFSFINLAAITLACIYTP